MILKAVPLVLAGSILASAAPAIAADQKAGDVGGRLQEVERAIERERKASSDIKSKEKALRREVETMRKRRITTARTIIEHEAALSALESELAELRATEAEKEKQLNLRRGQSARVLAALQRLAVLPPEAVIAQPVPPSDLVRGAVLLRAALPRIEDQAARLRDDLRALEMTRRDIADRQRQLAHRTEELGKERAHLETLLEKKSEQRRDLVEAERTRAKRLTALGQKADSLRDLFRRLDKERKDRATEAPEVTPEPKPEPPTAASRGGQGNLPFPAAGRIVGRYGEQIDTGMTRKGIDLETLPGAQVVAPFDGRIVFAGHFRGYGQLLIIEHGEGYHSLLAGMARIDGVVGHRVLAGEPVGRMGNPKTGRPSLYVELRRDGQPINPVPWLIARKGK